MRDLLGIAVAVLAGLITLAFQPWTPSWWAGVIISGSITSITATHIIWGALPAEIKARAGAASWAPDGTVRDGRIRAAIGIAVLAILVCGGSVASHWPTRFLKSESPPSGNPPEQTGPFISRLDHFLLQCEVPPPPPSKTPLDSLWELRDYKEKMDIYGDAIGVTFTMVTIRGGIRIEIEASSEQAKARLPLSKIGVTKFILEVRRIEKNELVSVFVNLPPQYGFYGLIAPNPKAPDSILVVQFIERFLGIKSGTCKII